MLARLWRSLDELKIRHPMSEAALKAHRQTPHYRECVDMIEPITLGGRGKEYFVPVMVEPSSR